MHQSRWSFERRERVLRKKGRGAHNGSINCGANCRRVLTSPCGQLESDLVKRWRYPYTGSLVALATCTPTTAKRGSTGMWWRNIFIRREKLEDYWGHSNQMPSLKFMQVNPFGVIPKSELGRWRLIVDLSSPKGGSVNEGICKEWCSLSYISVDDVDRAVVKPGKGALMAKFDLKAAYRNVPVHPDNRWLLGMVWENQLFVDVALPFGFGSTPMIFSALANGLEFMIRQAGVVEWDTT